MQFVTIFKRKIAPNWILFMLNTQGYHPGLQTCHHSVVLGFTSICKIWNLDFWNITLNKNRGQATLWFLDCTHYRV